MAKMAKKEKKDKGEKKSSTVNIQPIGDRVLVQPFDANDLSKKSPSGIIIPETIDKEKPEQGKVIAVGDGKKTDSGAVIAPSVKVGDTVVFSKYGFDEIKVDGVEYYMLREDSILAVIK